MSLHISYVKLCISRKELRVCIRRKVRKSFLTGVVNGGFAAYYTCGFSAADPRRNGVYSLLYV